VQATRAFFHVSTLLLCWVFCLCVPIHAKGVFVLHFQRTLTICKAGALLNGYHELSVAGVVLFSMQIVAITKEGFIHLWQ